jgi:hypothetical protein
MEDAAFQKGKMCCEKPMFHDDHELSDFTCDHCGKSGDAEECAEGIDNNFLHDDCVGAWEDKHKKVFERKEESEDEDEWMEVYQKSLFCHHSEEASVGTPYWGFTYYMCWGGGPEGGYITNGESVYRVNRSWFDPWTIESVDDKFEVCERDGLQYIRFTK